MSRKGFTLIEVMVAMVILAIGLLAVLKMTFVYVQGNTMNLQMGKGSVLAQDKMEQLRGYASSDRVDRFSVFDFDYLVSEEPNFSTVLVNPTTGVEAAVHGLLSGSNGGTEVPMPWGSVYEVMYDDGSHGDVTANDGTFSGSDVKDVMVTGGVPIVVERLWTVTPVYIPSRAANPKADYAMLTVKATWKDKAGVARSVELQSCINRRQ